MGATRFIAGTPVAGRAMSAWARLAASLWSPWPWAVLAPLCVASALVAPQYSHDSRFYVDMAQGVVAGRGPPSYYLDLAAYAIPNPRQSWPPGYPLFLAAGMALGLDADWSVRLVS